MNSRKHPLEDESGRTRRCPTLWTAFAQRILLILSSWIERPELRTYMTVQRRACLFAAKIGGDSTDAKVEIETDSLEEEN